MELKNTYLKYDESITKKVFDEILSKIKSHGFEWQGGIIPSYKKFKDDGLLIINDSMDVFVHHFVHDSRKQIKVSDILGEDEFKVGDWVCANGHGHTNGNKSFPIGVPWKILRLKPEVVGDKIYVDVNKDSTEITGTTTNTNAIRHATPEEIAKAKGETDSWCVEVTHENRKRVRDWWNTCDFKKDLSDPVFNYGAYYGITKKGIKHGHGKQLNVSDILLTTEQFYEKIGHKKEESDKESLLSEAKRRYPVGTKYENFNGDKCVSNGVFRTAKYESTWLIQNEHGRNAVRNYLGKWAEIIEKPEDSNIEGGYITSEDMAQFTKHNMSADSYKPRVQLLRRKKLNISVDNEVQIKIKKR